MKQDLQINVSKDRGYTIVRVVGEARLDVEQVEFQLDRLISQRPKHIIIDATQLSFCSSLGMRLMVNLQRSAVGHGGSAKLVGLQPMVQTSFGHARLLELFQIL